MIRDSRGDRSTWKLVFSETFQLIIQPEEEYTKVSEKYNYLMIIRLLYFCIIFTKINV